MTDGKKEMFKLLTDFGTIGLTISGCVFIGLGFGYYLDNKVLAARPLHG